MQIWLNGVQRMQFPVLPSEFRVTSERGDETVVINAIGEVDLGGRRNLRTVSFSSFFPNEYDPTICDTRSLLRPSDYVKTVELIKNGGPARLIITGTPARFWVRIPSFEWSMEDGTGDIHFTISLKEHRSVSIGKSNITTISG